MFDKKAFKFCLSKVPRTFVGLNISSGRNEKVNDLLKRKVPYEMSMPDVILAVDRLTSELDENLEKQEIEKTRYETLFKESRLSELRLNVPKQVFRVLIEAYVKSLRYSVRSLRATTDSYEILGHFKRTVTIRSPTIVTCSCGLVEKLGLPCSHTIKALS